MFTTAIIANQSQPRYPRFTERHGDRWAGTDGIYYGWDYYIADASDCYRFFPCMEVTYPYASSKGLWVPWAGSLSQPIRAQYLDDLEKLEWTTLEVCRKLPVPWVVSLWHHLIFWFLYLHCQIIWELEKSCPCCIPRMSWRAAILSQRDRADICRLSAIIGRNPDLITTDYPSLTLTHHGCFFTDFNQFHYRIQITFMIE